MKCIVNVNPGLQASPASSFVQTANRFSSEIYLTKGERRVNAKSIMGLLSLAIAKGDTIELKATGGDSDEAIQALGDFLRQDN
ncbi:HPr-like protein Crh [Halolactibacillus miurensis]|uniref:Catabolite repression HPr-like protein n=2 Tax=Bacillaceae TaxID=186817 RepID=A0A1I6RHJ6_9BACI|nr:HPr-like protein Crh [Halolactibacillus miurensis]SFS64199.1 catabolite repression HPr-like protein [Halolactibacillus miurensis]